MSNTQVKIDKLLALNDGKCHLCQRVILSHRPPNVSDQWWERWAPSRDHVIPRSEVRGLHNNVMPAHRLCNTRRGTMPVEAFREKMAKLREAIAPKKRKAA